jgi:hypothetical protein
LADPEEYLNGLVEEMCKIIIPEFPQNDVDAAFVAAKDAGIVQPTSYRLMICPCGKGKHYRRKGVPLCMSL